VSPGEGSLGDLSFVLSRGLGDLEGMNTEAAAERVAEGDSASSGAPREFHPRRSGLLMRFRGQVVS